LHQNPSIRTEYDEAQFESVEKLRNVIGIKKPVKIKSISHPVIDDEPFFVKTS